LLQGHGLNRRGSEIPGKPALDVRARKMKPLIMAYGCRNQEEAQLKDNELNMLYPSDLQRMHLLWTVTERSKQVLMIRTVPL
jgi:hypothetical protein